jgi:hypothetical protein
MTDGTGGSSAFTEKMLILCLCAARRRAMRWFSIAGCTRGLLVSDTPMRFRRTRHDDLGCTWLVTDAGAVATGSLGVADHDELLLILHPFE